MTKTAKKIALAFANHRSLLVNNTDTDGKNVYLFNKLIMWRDEDDNYHFTMAGYGTATTKERLNTLFHILKIDLHIYQYNFELFLITPHGEMEISSNEIFSVQDLLNGVTVSRELSN